MDKKGVLIRLDVKAGMDDQVEEFLQSALSFVDGNSRPSAWYGLRFGRSEYGIFDVFESEEERHAYLDGPVTKKMMENAAVLLNEPPEIMEVEILAEKLPRHTPVEEDKKALLLTFKAKKGNEAVVEQFLKDAEPIVEDEPETTAWFAIQFDNGEYGIFDVFHNNRARMKYLVGKVQRELLQDSLVLLGKLPELEMLNVIAEKINSK